MIYYKYKIFCETDNEWEYVILDQAQSAPTKCPNDTTHTVLADSVAIIETINTDEQKVEVTSIPAMASKTVGTKKLFKRVNGIQSDVVVGNNEIFFVCPYPWAKFLGIEFFWAAEGTFVSLEVFDTPEGLISGVPNYKLNQFGFNANIASGFYSHKSEFDADIFEGMVIKITYNSNVSKRIGINFIMNEMKD